MRLSYRLADAPPYLQTLHAEQMERVRRANAMAAEMRRLPLMLSATPEAIAAALEARVPKRRLVVLAPVVAPSPEPPPADPETVSKPTVRQIVVETARHFNVGYEEIRSHRRKLAIVIPRQIAMYLAHALTSASYPQIGRWVAERDHSTTMHAVSKIAEWRRDAARTTDADCRAIAARLGASLD